MADKKKTECDSCGELALCHEDSFGHGADLCDECYEESREAINEHHRNVGMSCYCHLCM